MKLKKVGKPAGNKKIKIYHCDCMKIMKQLPDGYFDLSVVDFPYGIKTTADAMGGRKVNKEAREQGMTWDDKLPKEKYFTEVIRVSRQWIFWGANWMPYLWREPRKNIIVWNKKIRGLDFADCEIAVSNIDDGARIYDRSANDKKRLHPNQKPIKLYSWLLERYADKDYKVFDPTIGSGSSAIAAHYFGCSYIGCEREDIYFKAAIKRFEKETRQQTLFKGFGV